MAKLYGPLFSVEAQGQFGKALIFTGSINPRVKAYHFTARKSNNPAFLRRQKIVAAKARTINSGKLREILEWGR